MRKEIFYLTIASGILIQSCKDKTAQTPATPSVEKGVAAAASGLAGAKIVYVNVDTLEDKYTYFKQQRAALEQKQKNLSSSLEGKIQQLQSEMVALQQKAQQGTTPPAEIQKQGQALQNREQALMKERDSKAKEFMDETTKFQEDLMKKINAVLAQIQKEKGYDYVLRHTEAGGSALMYVNPSLDITNEVIAILNAAPQK